MNAPLHTRHAIRLVEVANAAATEQSVNQIQEWISVARSRAQDAWTDAELLNVDSALACVDLALSKLGSARTELLKLKERELA
jgi:hypothetical protein